MRQSTNNGVHTSRVSFWTTPLRSKRSKPEKLPPHPRYAAESIFLVAWCFLMMLPVIYSSSYFKLYFDASVEMYLLTFSKIVLRIFYHLQKLEITSMTERTKVIETNSFLITKKSLATKL